MSTNDLADGQATDVLDGHGISVAKLRSELNGERPDDEEAVSDLVDEVVTRLFDGEPFEFREDLVKTSIESLLLTVVAVRPNGSNGKDIIEHFANDFDNSLSPGTVYPILHSLHDEGTLEMQELVRTKEYSLSDAEGVRERLAEAAEQHLAMGFVFERALAELDAAE